MPVVGCTMEVLGRHRYWYALALLSIDEILRQVLREFERTSIKSPRQNRNEPLPREGDLWRKR
jgi:hypothetical protein